MGILIIIILSIWGVFNPEFASWFFIGFILLMESTLYLSLWSGNKITHKKLKPEENVLLQKYNLYLRYPFTSRKLSSTISAIQISALFWVPLLIYKGGFAQAGIIGLNYFVASPLSFRLNPRYFLSKGAEKGDVKSEYELLALDSVIEKIHGYNPSTGEKASKE